MTLTDRRGLRLQMITETKHNKFAGSQKQKLGQKQLKGKFRSYRKKWILWRFVVQIKIILLRLHSRVIFFLKKPNRREWMRTWRIYCKVSTAFKIMKKCEKLLFD